MNKLKSLVALVLALALTLTLVGAAMATTVETAKITIEDANPGQTYTFYRVFDAVIGSAGVSYKVIPGHTLPANDYFTVDAQGNVSATAAAKSGTELTAGAIAWLKTNAATVGELETTASLATGATAQADLEVTGLNPGYYYITTTTGTVVSAHTSSGTTVTDKNPPTDIDKEITGVGTGDVTADKEKALAQIGTTVNFEAAVEIQNGAKNYVFKDNMSAGLTLDVSTVKVYLRDQGSDTEVTSGFGTVTTDNTATTETIKIVFAQDWLTDNVGKTIVVKYSATVNASAYIADQANPNKAIIEWGNTDDFLHKEDEVEVWSAKITVKKVDGNGAALEGAGFVLKNASDKYYKNTDGIVSWVDTQNAATEIFPVQATDAASGEKTGDAVAAFTGLANGTYTLIEKTVPAGYNKAPDKTIEIKDADAQDLNLAVETTVTNQAGTELPSTGGIGTTIFYIAGIVLVLGAAAIIIARRKAEQE
jgi:fimbrial isopeptide formation D2 family protein/LPXTG-motif cell wall-anchored protein